jgi:hypothetical protein
MCAVSICLKCLYKLKTIDLAFDVSFSAKHATLMGKN